MKAKLFLLALFCVVVVLRCSENNDVFNTGSEDQEPSGELIILSSEHPGWGRSDCFHCHPTNRLSSIHDGITEESDCQGCHGENGTGSGIKLCTTCHGNPPVTGAHDRHFAMLTGIIDCLSCHNTSGGASPNHRNSILDVSIDKQYGGSWDGVSCSSVSCHGCGAPRWYLDTGLDCTDCHSMTCGAENDISSGKHGEHMNYFNNQCNICHVSGPSTHYNGVLDNPDNIRPDGGYYHDDTSNGYNSSGVSGTCSGMTSPCHTGSAEWLPGEACGACHGASNANPPSTCAHPFHAGTRNYSCRTCHYGFENGNTNNHINGIKEVVFDPASLAGNNSPTYNGTSCINVYCHGAGIPGLTGGTNYQPEWCNPSSVYCGACHGATASAPPTSGSHDKHASMGGLGYDCTTCHMRTSAQHVNGMIDVQFDPGAGGWNASAYFDSVSCNNVYCHGEGSPPLSGGTDTTPEWGNPSTTFCGSCHGIPPTSGKHDWHVTTMGFSCSFCHLDAGFGTPKHVNFVRDVIFDPTKAGTDAYISGGKCYNLDNTLGYFCHTDVRDWYL